MLSNIGQRTPAKRKKAATRPKHAVAANSTKPRSAAICRPGSAKPCPFTIRAVAMIHSRNDATAPAVIEPIGSDRKAGEEIDDVLRRERRLKSERPEIHPFPRCKDDSQGDIRQRRHARQTDEKTTGSGGDLAQRAGHALIRTKRKREHAGGADVKREKKPAEPHRSFRQERQC